MAKNCGFDLACFIRFNLPFSKQTPEQFVESCLKDKFHARLVVVGEDWAFGRGREGSAEALDRLGTKFGFEVEVVKDVKDHSGQRISSTRVREALAKGDLDSVKALLGREFYLSGRVLHGDKRGKQLGYPTANLDIKGQLLPRFGIYATRTVVGARSYISATNVGIRPSFQPPRVFVETHILDADLHLYQQRIKIEFVKWLRDEKRFDDLEELKQAIADDIVQTRKTFSK